MHQGGENTKVNDANLKEKVTINEFQIRSLSLYELRFERFGITPR